jgi:outer membrane protein OmpA-like peptidoglycan-associated protein
MNNAYKRIVWTVGMVSLSTAALADTPKPPPPQEPAGFITGGIIGGFAAGPIGAVIGAGIGTWLGNRVHKAGEAKKAEAEVAALKGDKSELEAKTAQLETAREGLTESNLALKARLDELSHSVSVAQAARNDAARLDAAKVLDGLQGDVLFRTGSAEITPEMAHGIKVLADAVAKSPALKVRVDGYADPRGTADANLMLSEARANAVRDMFLAAGVNDEALEINAYGKSQSIADDPDGYALERRVRLTLEAPGFTTQASTGGVGEGTGAFLAPTGTIPSPGAAVPGASVPGASVPGTSVPGDVAQTSEDE